MSVTFLSLSYRKETDYQQVQQNMLQSHRWVLDSFYIRHKDDFKVDTVQSLDYTHIEYGSLTYSVFNLLGGIQSDTMISYQFNATDSRIYYWQFNSKKDKDVYHNIQNLTDTRLVFAGYLPDGAWQLKRCSSTGTKFPAASNFNSAGLPLLNTCLRRMIF